jgi:hypothetical protein
MDKGVLLAIIGGLTVFFIVLGLILHTPSDFDQYLIEQVEKGVSADKLIPQIDQETVKLKKKLEGDFASKVANKDVKKTNMSRNDYEHYTETYENGLKMISEYDAACKKYVRREITKEQFLLEIKNSKEFIEMMNY